MTGYKITTANDNAQYTGRNPKSWTLYGSTSDSNPGKDDASWEVIATVTNDTKLKDVNFTTYTYTLPSETAKAYQSFKWVITARSGGGNNVIQVSEFRPTFNDALVEVDPVARPRVTITDRAEKDGKYFGTYVATTDIDFTGSEVTAYAGQVNPNYVHLEPLTLAPKGTALVVTAAAPDTYFLTKTADATLSVSNDLLGSDGTVEGDGNIYALAKLDGAVGFFQVKTGTEVPEGKAYFTSGAGIKGYLFDGDDATGINGQSSPVNVQWYNVAGQRLVRPAKGINITQNKKILK